MQTPVNKDSFQIGDRAIIVPTPYSTYISGHGMEVEITSVGELVPEYRMSGRLSITWTGPAGFVYSCSFVNKEFDPITFHELELVKLCKPPK